MTAQLATAHIEAQAQLRDIAVHAVDGAWGALPNYDEVSVSPFLRLVLPVLIALQRQSVSLADAYVARMLRRPAAGIDPAPLIARLRGGVPASEVYRRPFVTVWSALQDGTPYTDAVAAGRDRATSSAALDVQMTQRAGLQALQDAIPAIRSWQRVADPDACVFCQLVDGAKLLRADALALHPRCGCSIEPRPEEVPPSSLPDGVAVRMHGEYGPTLGDPDHEFKGPDDV